MTDFCVWCSIGKHNKIDMYVRYPCKCDCHASSVVTEKSNLSKHIQTLSGLFVSVEFKENVGVIVKQSSGSTVSRIILSKDAAIDLSNQLILASVDASKNTQPSLVSQDEHDTRNRI